MQIDNEIVLNSITPKMESKSKITVKEAFSLLTIFLLIYFSNETLLFGTNSNEHIKLIGYCVIFFLTIIWCIQVIYNGWKHIPLEQIKVYKISILFFICICLTAIFNLEFSLKYGYEIMLFVLAIALVLNISFSSFVKYYTKILVFLAVISLICSLCYYLMYPIFAKFPIISNTAGMKFSYLFFTNISIPLNGIGYRNYGIFREPGVYIIYLILALIFELWTNKDISIFRIAVLSLTVLTTFSTAGYIVLFCTFLTYLMSNKTKKKYRKFIVITLTATIIISSLFGGGELFSKVFSKLFSPNASMGSRIGSIKVNCMLWLHNIKSFFFGNGFLFVEKNFLVLSKQIDSNIVSNTNTFMKILAVHGLLYFIVFLLLNIKFMQRIGTNKWDKLLLFIILILLYSNEDLIVNPLIYIIAFYSLSIGERKIDNSCSN